MAENSLVWNFIARDKASKTVDTLGDKMGRLGKTIAVGLGVAAVGGVAGLTAAFVQGVRDAQSYQTLALKTAQVIKSTGNVAHVSVGGIQSLASNLETLSGVDEELIINSENVLLTFTKVRNEAGKGNDIFNQGAAAALNMSVALGTDLQGATIQIGKALNDPIKGITALSRAGVSFTAQQKEQIKQMVASGNVMGAQKLILKELNTEFGGAAKAAGSGLAGAIAHLKDVWGDFWRDTASRFLPQITAAVRWFADFLPKALGVTVDAISRVAGAIGRVNWSGITAGLGTVAGTVRSALGKIDWSGLTGGARTAVGAAQRELGRIDFSGIATRLVASAKSWGQSLIGGIREGMRTGDWSTLGETIGTGISSAVGRIGRFLLAGVGKLSDLFGQLFEKIDWVGIGITIGKQAPSLLIGLAAGLLNFDLFGLLRGLASHWQDIILAILAIAFTPGRIIGKVAELLARIPLVGRLLAWALEHFAGFAKGLVKMVGDALGFMGRAFLEGFRRVFPGIGTSFGAALKLLPLRVALITIELQARVGRMIIGMAETVARFIGRVVAAIGELIARMLRPFANAGTWLIQHGNNFIRGLLSGVGNFARQIPGRMADVIRALITPYRVAGTWLLRAGGDLIGGLLQGTRNAMGGIGGWIRDIGNRIVGAVKNFFGIHSPSTVFMGLGANMIQGLLRGLASTNPLDIAKKALGGLPEALGGMVNKGLVSIEALPSKAWNAISGLGGKIGGVLSGLFGGGGKSIGAGVNRWRSVAAAALAYTHSPAEWLPSLLARMQRESGGNQFAINNWDINAKRGDPSRGLMQTIMGTFLGYARELAGRGIYDPFANIVASIRYANAAYGSAPRGWNRPGGYDQGGWLMPGYTPSWNGTNQKEAVFTQSQLREFRASGTDGSVTFIHNGPLIGDDVDEFMVRKIDSLKRRKRI